MDLISIPKSFWEQIRGFCGLLRQKPSSVHIVRVEFNLSGLVNNAVHVSGFCGEVGGTVELNAVPLASTVHSCN
jgi:hypothetical protein